MSRQAGPKTALYSICIIDATFQEEIKTISLKSVKCLDSFKENKD